MVFYALIIGLLFGFSLLHFIIYKIFGDDKSQFLMLGVIICYGLITILKRMVAGTLVSGFVAQLLSFPLMTAVFILIAVYVAEIISRSSFRVYSWMFYITITVIFAVGTVIYVICRKIDIFYIGLAVLSFEYLCFGVFYMHKCRGSLTGKQKAMLIGTYIMIFSFTVLAILTIMNVRQVYWCALGVFAYIIIAETVNIRRMIDILAKRSASTDNADLSATEEQIISMLESGLTPKEVAADLHLSLLTVYRYQQNIAHKHKS